MSFVKGKTFNFPPDFANKIMDCAYKNDISISISEVEDVLAIELRDALLEKFPD